MRIKTIKRETSVLHESEEFLVNSRFVPIRGLMFYVPSMDANATNNRVGGESLFGGCAGITEKHESAEITRQGKRLLEHTCDSGCVDNDSRRGSKRLDKSRFQIDCRACENIFDDKHRFKTRWPINSPKSK